MFTISVLSRMSNLLFGNKAFAVSEHCDVEDVVTNDRERNAWLKI